MPGGTARVPADPTPRATAERALPTHLRKGLVWEREWEGEDPVLEVEERLQEQLEVAGVAVDSG